MSFLELLQWGCRELEAAAIADSEIDAWYLLADVCQFDRAHYLAYRHETPEEEWIVRYRQHVAQRKQHMPLQYIVGSQEFMGLDFCVDEHVLIPRQDTEVLVEQAAEFACAGMRVLDLCTGSGCILISLMKLIPGMAGIGVDISAAALAVARENAMRHGVNAAWLESDLMKGVEGCFDLILSNPPYIKTAVIEELAEEVRAHEPRIALDGMEDGLFFYRKIISQVGSHLCDGGRLYFEIGYDQAQEVSGLMTQAGYADIRIVQDLAGHDRVVYGEKLVS